MIKKSDKIYGNCKGVDAWMCDGKYLKNKNKNGRYLD